MSTDPRRRLNFESERPVGPCPVADPDDSAGAVRAGLAGQRYESASHIAVCRADGHLAGVVRIEDVLAADGETPRRGRGQPRCDSGRVVGR